MESLQNHRWNSCATKFTPRVYSVKGPYWSNFIQLEHFCSQKMFMPQKSNKCEGTGLRFHRLNISKPDVVYVTFLRSGYIWHVSSRVLFSPPHYEKFSLALRCYKIWAGKDSFWSETLLGELFWSGLASKNHLIGSHLYVCLSFLFYESLLVYSWGR